MLLVSLLQMLLVVVSLVSRLVGLAESLSGLPLGCLFHVLRKLQIDTIAAEILVVIPMNTKPTTN